MLNVSTFNRHGTRRLSLLMILVMIFSMFPFSSGAQASDLTGHWAASVVTEWMNKGWISGYPDGTFKPEGTMTRAEFMTIINKVYNFSAEKDIAFTDVKSSDWFYSAVKKAYAAGYITGYPGNMMKPNAPIQRQEVAAIYTKLENLNQDAEAAKFTDVTAGSWSIGYIGAAVKAGYFTGYGDGKFKPTADIKRGEAVSATNAVYSNRAVVYDKEGTFGPATGTTEIAKNVIIKKTGVTLQNLVIKGNLTIDEAVGEGDVSLNNVTVTGELYIKGGGSNSVKINGGGYGKVFVMKQADTPVRLLAINVKNLNVVIPAEAAGGQIILEGVFNNVSVLASKAQIVTQGNTTINEISFSKVAIDVKVNLGNGTVVAKLITEVVLTVLGQGRIVVADVKVVGVVFEKAPETVNTTINGETTTKTNTPGTTPGTGGGSTGGDSALKTVTPVTVANVAITQGSIVYTYTFQAGTTVINYAAAKAAPYYLNTSGSSVTIANESGGTATKSLEAFTISDAGTVTFANISEASAAFGGINFIPTKITLNLVGATVVNGGNNQWAYTVTRNLSQSEMALMSPPVDLVATPTATPGSGAVTSGTSITLNSVTSGASIFYTTDGSTPTTSSTPYVSPINILSAVTIKAIAVKTGMTDSAVATFVYTLVSAPGQVEAPTAVTSPSAVSINGAFAVTSGSSITFSSATSNVQLFYTVSYNGTNPATPTTSSTLYTGPITFTSGSAISVIAVKQDQSMTNSPVSTFYFIEALTSGSAVTVTSGSATGTTRVIFTPSAGNTIKIIKSSTAIAVPRYLEIVAGTTDYTSNTDITGVTVGSHVGVYEVDGAGQTIRFVDLILESGQVTP